MAASVSVVVPTLNEASGIGSLLESLRRQSYPVSELIVADGGSTDGTRDIVARDPAVTLVDNPRRHAAAGRNVALRRCTTDWVLFTDGDCRPAPDWALELMAAARSGPDVVAVGGRLTAEPATAFERVCARMLLEAVLRHSAGSRPVTAKTLDGALVTANCAYRRHILERVGGFDERFANFGEDIDLMFRVLDLNAGRLLHTANAVVVGDMPDTLGATVRKWRQYGMASSYLNKYHYRRISVDAGLYRRLFETVRTAAIASGAARTEALICAVQLVAHIGGKVEGSVRLRTVNL
ncbi:MAG: glycosyltransferase [Mycobacteriaceae bacterium]|nr:glycosyltransferase [Mycobacteriaceae bacterium]MBV9641386.1 glycosyltransferase [Mycobacteriaceae bacterium]